MHLPEAHVCLAVHAPPVDVVAEVGMGHEEHAHITHGANVTEVLHRVIHQPGPYPGTEAPQDKT